MSFPPPQGPQGPYGSGAPAGGFGPPQGFGQPGPPGHGRGFGPPGGPGGVPGGGVPGGGGPGGYGQPPYGGPPHGPGGGSNGAKVAALVVGVVLLAAVAVGGVVLLRGGGDADEGARARPGSSPGTGEERESGAPRDEDTADGPGAAPEDSGAPEDGGAPDDGAGREDGTGPGELVPFVVLAPGECFDHPALSSSVSAVEKRPCDGPHNGEVIANDTLTGTFASERELRAKVLELCRADAAQRLGTIPQNGRRYYFYAIYPSLDTYRIRGEDTVSCSLTLSNALDGPKLTAPLPG
ncbi:hypothetical protein [Streptomyces sp. JJ36]|uniref:hypothetical protein n=1 Tax=Streptomyces sp. JJ36 TaxID=2736645 RepID=UPI001F31F2DC|nr:hypothetical protein [Streptomyces sp. JJ36]MCF6525708.1 hypothetical protein [Streptomyces sp. JJ36]